MSLDRDASDRSLDRQLAHLGLLDDAAPLFRAGSSVPGAGVLFALPCLVESGLFRISRKLYGEVGPAFYGLRTTLLTLLRMALLRIKGLCGAPPSGHARQHRLLGQRPLRRPVARDYRRGRRCLDEGLAPAAARSAGPSRRATGHHRLRPRRLEPEVVRYDDQGWLRLVDLSQGPMPSHQ